MSFCSSLSMTSPITTVRRLGKPPYRSVTCIICTEPASFPSTVCAPWTCSPDPQLAIDQDDWCENYEPDAYALVFLRHATNPTVTFFRLHLAVSRSKSTATYYNSGTSYEYSLKVASQKTLLGSGSSGGMWVLFVTSPQNLLRLILTFRYLARALVC